MTAILAGIRVIEVAEHGFVPGAGALLAGWGAEVIKVEPVERGDAARGLATAASHGVNVLFQNANRRKRSIGLDLASPEGQDVLYQLVATADVFLTNKLPRVRKRLCIDVDDLRAHNPRIVYVRGSGQGVHGPEAHQGGFDGLTYWSRGGVSAALTTPGADHPVRMAGPGFGDVQSGAMLAGGVAAALFQRERTGKGVVVDSSLLATAMWAMQPSIVAAELTGVEVLPISVHDEIGNPLTNNYRTSDDRYVGLGMLESDRFWPGFCQACDVPEWLEDPRFADSGSRAQHREELTALLDELFARRPLTEWKSVLGRQEGPWTVVQYPAEVARDPQAEANGYVQTVEYDNGRTLRLVSAPVQFGGSPGTLTPAPDHGADTDDVLQELGFSRAGIARLKDAGAIG